MKLPYEIICIDIETTDTDSKLGDIIQIGAVAMNKEFKVIDSFSIFIKPLTSYRNPKAMAVNKISEETLASAHTLENALMLFENFCKNAKLLAAWGTYFDITFLRASYAKIYRDWPVGYRSLDLKSIAIWEFAKMDSPLGGGVFKACQRLGIEFEGPQHDGLADIQNTVKILQKMLTYKYSPFETGWNKKVK